MSEGKRILVTGSGSGLGKAIATRFAAAGWRVLVSDVDKVAAKAVADELKVSAIPLDVTDDDSWASALEWVEREWGGLDVLVNNAGVASGGRFERIPLADWDWVYEINVKGVVRGCRTFVPLFKKQGSGHLVNVASLAAIMNLPGMASYNVTKSAVVSLSETLRLELEPYGIATTVLCPGFFQTNLNDRMRSPDPAAIALSQKLMTAATVTASDVADQTFDAVAAKRFLVLTHADSRRSHRFKRYLPAVVDRQVRKYWSKARHAMEREDTA